MLTMLDPNGAAGAKWQTYLDRLPEFRRDIHYTPAYARAQLCIDTAIAALYVDSTDFVLQPFALRTTPFVDTCSLYGCGGPIASNALQWDRFDNALGEWRQRQGVLCEYGQLNPFLQGYQRGFIKGAFDISHVKNVIVKPLAETDEAILGSFSRNRQRGVKGALKSGIKVRTTTDWRQFASMYRESMKRLNAKSYWLYPDEIWEAYLRELGQDHCTLFTSGAAMLLVLHGYGRAYAHFLASTTQDTNDLLYFESMKYCRDSGAFVYHIGGGLTSSPEDPLLSYKAGFSKETLPVYTYKRVFDQEGYDEACKGVPETSFFPAYRSPDANRTKEV